MKTYQKVLIGIGVVVALAALAVGTSYLSGVVFLLACKKNVLLAKPFSFLDWWNTYQDDPLLRKKLKQSLGAAIFLLDMLLPMFIAMAIFGQKRELHGSARFASLPEIKKSGLRNGKGIIVGKDRDKYLGLSGNRFVLLAAPTRSGKGVSVVIPNLLSWADSAVVLDMKGECFKITSGFREKNGHEVYAFAPYDEECRTHRYNPLAYVRKDPKFRVGDLQSIGSFFYPPQQGDDDHASGFWNNQARDLFMGLGLYLAETPELSNTIGELLRQSSGKGKPIKQHLQDLIVERQQAKRPLSDECVHAMSRFLSNPDNTLSNISSTFNAPLTLWANPLIDLATSGNDFSLEDLRKKRMTVYVVVPPGKLTIVWLLLNLFFSQLLELNTRELPENNKALKHRCLLVLDEFPAIGRLPIMTKSAAFIAGYGLRLLTIVQSMSQLYSDKLYGRHDAKAFADNHALQILFTPKDNEDAKEYSEWLGTYTEKSESKSRNRATMGNGRSSEGVNVSPQRRPLMLPQELREMGEDTEIIMLENVKPIQCKRIVYYSDPTFQSRLLPPVEVPSQDFNLYTAKSQRRKREVTPDDVSGGVDLSVLAHNLDDVQELTPPATQEQVNNYVQGIFGLLSVKPVDLDELMEEGAEKPSYNTTPLLVRQSVSTPAREYIDLAELEM